MYIRQELSKKEGTSIIVSMNASSFEESERIEIEIWESAKSYNQIKLIFDKDTFLELFKQAKKITRF